MKLNNVTLSYGKKVVAEGINAELLPGELVCLVGRNGVGKSTLIRHILNMGEGISVEDTPSTREGRGGVIPKLISVVLTDRIDIDNMTVRDVVAMGRMPYTGFFGILKDEDRAIVNDSMHILCIDKFAERHINTLSDGERQKVIIAKALAQQTPYILLDEPTAFLDHPSKVSTMQLLSRLCKEQNKAILISTHDLEVSLPHCDKVWHMADGTLKEIAPEDFPIDSL